MPRIQPEDEAKEAVFSIKLRVDGTLRSSLMALS
jgi:hypothetical protein